MPIQRIADLPTPPSDGLLGHLDSLRSPDFHLRFRQWSRDLGGIYRVRLAQKKAVVIGQRSLLQQVIKARPKQFRRHKNIESVFKDLDINGIFSAEGSDWRQQRELFNPAFNGANLRYFFPTISRVTDQLVTKAQSLANAGQPVDIKRLFTEYTLDTISNLAFAYDINSLSGNEEALHQHLACIFPGINARLSSPIPIWKLYKNSKEKRLEQAVVAIKAFLNERIDATQEILNSNPSLREQPENLLQAMIVEQEKQCPNLHNNSVLSNAVTVLLAGEDTTANSLAWLSHLLSIHPDMQQALLKEIQALPDDVLSQWPLPKTPFLNACIHESMRVKPVAPLLYASALEEVSLEGLIIPEGTLLVLLTNTLNDDETCFDKPSQFNPYRWLGDNHARVSDMAPFGGGPRVCPGRSLALLEIKLAMARLLKTMTFEAIPGTEVKERFDFVVMPENLSIQLKLNG